MVAIIDSPDFMFSDEDVNSYSKIKKFRLFIKGIIVGLIFENTGKQTFCFFMNTLFRSKNKIFYEDGFYTKKILGKYNFSYPNKRIVRIIKNESHHLRTIFQSYCLDELQFEKNDVIIDCGANVGELRYSFLEMDIDVNYISFEPDPYSFKCLEKNISTENLGKINNIGLSNENAPKEFFIDAEGANSSLEYFGTKKSVTIESKKLDNFSLDKIKLLKIEAEGHEKEVLDGAIETLKKTQYVAVDYGPEKGIYQESTASDVINLLYEVNFELIKTSSFREIGLFKNKNLEIQND